jgi:hypothetical protein
MTRVIFQNRKGKRISDQDLLRAWSHVSTSMLEAHCAGPANPDDEVRKTRERVLRLRRAAEGMA